MKDEQRPFEQRFRPEDPEQPSGWSTHTGDGFPTAYLPIDPSFPCSRCGWRMGIVETLVLGTQHVCWDCWRETGGRELDFDEVRMGNQ